MIKRILHILLVFCLGIQAAIAQTSLTATVDKNKLSSNDRLQIDFTLNADGVEFDPPAFSDFLILAGPKEISGMQIYNGQMVMETTVRYFLRPKKEGTLTIETAKMTAQDGKVYKSKPIKIKVSDSYVDENDPLTKARKNISLKLDLSKTKVYKGEQLIATYKLYFTEDIRNLSRAKEPEYDGFWKQDIDLDGYSISKEIIDGKRYKVIVLKKMVLIPQKTGKIVIDPMEIELPVYIESNRGDYAWRRVKEAYNVEVKSKARTIEVKPLPKEGRPENFSGAVGQFRLQTNLSKDSVETNESVNLEIKLKGTGNIKLADLPAFDIPSVIETYDPKNEENIKVGNAGQSGTKSRNYLLIPRNRGEYKISGTPFSYFDPKRKRYVTTPAPTYTLKVYGEDQATGSIPVRSSSKESVSVIGKDIMFIKTIVPEFISAGEPFFGSTKFYVLFFAPFLLVFILAIVMKNKRNHVVDAVAVKNKRANKVAKQRLKKVKDLMDAGSNDAFYEELSGAMWGYLADKLNIPGSRMTKENVAELVAEKNVSESLVNEWKSIVEACEFARFASGGANTVGDLYQRSIDLIQKLENEL